MAKGKSVLLESLPDTNTVIPDAPITADVIAGMVSIRLKKTGGVVKVHHTMLKHYPEDQWERLTQKKTQQPSFTQVQEEVQINVKPVTNN